MGKGCFLFLLLFVAVSGLYLAREAFLKKQPGPEQDKPPIPPPAESSTAAAKQQHAVPLPAVDVEIFNPWGGQLPTVPAVLAEGKMVVLPTRACLGGADFTLKAALQTKQILKGFWRKGNPLIMWQTKDPAPAGHDNDLRIAPWNGKDPLRWVPIGGSTLPKNVTVASVRNAGDFLSCLLAEPVHEYGVLIQDNRLVGWTFKDAPDTCYLWNDATSERLESADIWPADFYKATFAGGREESLVRALNLPPETDPAARLAALLEALRIEPKLSPSDVPQNLRTESIRETIASLTAQMTTGGQYRDLVAVFSNPALSSLIDEKSISSTIYATIDRYGYDSAIELLGIIMANGSGQSAVRAEQYQALRIQVFREWLEKLVAGKDTRGGRRLFAEVKTLYPLNPEFQLLGVELALQESDWQQAENLLYAMHYPSNLQSKADNLASLISQLKGRDGKITIHFPAGHKIIPVTAVLNDTLKHNFFIDTGATMVTIPLATAEELGIEITPDTPQRLVSTAGGVQTAYEVTITSITIGNWAVYDTKAYIIDIPGNPNIGLLGLNFLRKFRMDLDTEKGILVLEPL